MLYTFGLFGYVFLLIKSIHEYISYHSYYVYGVLQ